MDSFYNLSGSNGRNCRGMKTVNDSFGTYTINYLMKKNLKLISACPDLYFGWHKQKKKNWNFFYPDSLKWQNCPPLLENPDASLVEKWKYYRRDGRKVLHTIREEMQMCGWILMTARCVRLSLCLRGDSVWAPFALNFIAGKTLRRLFVFVNRKSQSGGRRQIDESWP